jgi:hypothetical protein
MGACRTAIRQSRVVSQDLHQVWTNHGRHRRLLSFDELAYRTLFWAHRRLQQQGEEQSRAANNNNNVDFTGH